jgi:HD-GYP domain-containing protein (c-di-GMP phosphodiesterase class II)
VYKKRTAVEDLQLGMYVIELDRPWLGTPFEFQGFYLVSQDQIEELRQYCQHVYVDADRDEASAERRRAASAIPGSIPYTDAKPVENELAVASAAFETCKEAIRESLESLRREAKMDAAKLTAASVDMTESMERNPNAMLLLNSLHTKSSYELRRAVDSSVLMIAFGRFLQFARDRLQVLGLAGMLLDVGKTQLPDDVLHKGGTLTADEYALMKSHVMHSVELVRAANGSLPAGLEEIIIQHHERQDGTGYPYGLRGSQISMDGAIAGIADTLSALTSTRPFAEAIAPSSALNQLHAMRASFHEALVEQFIQCIGIYPVGSAVELNTGEVGVVMAQNLVRRLLPRVMLVLDAAWNPLPPPQVILKLMREPKNATGEPYRIRRTLPMDKLPIDPNDFFLPWFQPESGARTYVDRRS